MAMKGMNIDNVRTVAGQIGGEKLTTISETLRSVNPMVAGTQWEGEDKTNFVGEVESIVANLTTQVDAALADIQQRMEANAQAQELTSAN